MVHFIFRMLYKTLKYVIKIEDYELFLLHTNLHIMYLVLRSENESGFYILLLCAKFRMFLEATHISFLFM